MNNNSTINTRNKFKIDNLAQTSYEVSLDILKRSLEAIDNEIMSKPERKHQYKVHGFYSRTITTTYGTITFKRRLYVNKETNESVFLLDALVGIHPYNRITDDAILKIAEAAADCKSYKNAGLYALTGTIISRQTVYNCLKKVEVIRKEQKEKIDADVIHISVDGFYVAYKDFKNKTETKFANIFTGIKQEAPNRNKLIHKTILSQSSMRSGSFKQDLLDILYKYYNITDNTKIYFGGDGAHWIKSLSEYIPHSIFVIDKFHYKRCLKHFPDSEKAFKDFKDRNLDGLKEQVSNCKSELQKEEVNYVIDFFDDTKHWDDKEFICVAAENVVSHVYNHRIRGIPRHWGSNLFKMCDILSLKATNSLKLDLVKEEDKVIEKYNSISDLFFSYNFDVADTNIPLFNYKNTTMGKYLKDLIH